HEKGCAAVKAVLTLQPTTWPRSFTAKAWPMEPPRLPRSIIPPSRVHENGRKPGPLPKPTTCPRALIAQGWLETAPGGTPRSIIPPAGVHKNVCDGAPTPVLLAPTTSPLAFTATAKLPLPPRVPRSIGMKGPSEGRGGNSSNAVQLFGSEHSTNVWNANAIGGEFSPSGVQGDPGPRRNAVPNA